MKQQELEEWEKARLLLIGELKTEVKYGTPGTGKVMFASRCPACGRVHKEEISPEVDKRSQYFLTCPVTQAPVHMIYA
jgi:hypothetical protein